MNRYEVIDAAEQWKNHPVLGPASKTLDNLREVVDNNSDGWGYWPKPAKAAAKLMELIATAPTRYGDREEAAAAALKAALRPIKTFRTQSGLQFEIVENLEEVAGKQSPTVDGVMHVKVTVLAKVKVVDYTTAYGVTEAEAIEEIPDKVREHVLWGVQEAHKHHDVYTSFELVAE
jgi:hypothetical protein